MNRLYRYSTGWVLESEGTLFEISLSEVRSLFSGSISVKNFLNIERRKCQAPSTPPFAPVLFQEIWASGLTYKRSVEAWSAESANSGSIYDAVYSSKRVQTFFKGMGYSVTGADSYIGIRGDSMQTHPEAELAVICNASGQVIGYTLGNDVSARDIEMDNPLFQPQSKVFDCSIALGPALVLAEPGVSPLNWRINLAIHREDRALFEGGFPVNQLSRSINEIVDAHFAYRSLKDGIVILTGTALAIPTSAMLKEGDIVTIWCDEVGRLMSKAKRLG